MNWCTFGIHDDETINDKKLVEAAITSHMECHGYTLFENEGMSGSWKKGGAKVRVYGWHESAINYIVPHQTVTRVCLRCHRIKKTYDLDKIRAGMDLLITEAEEADRRRKEAQKLRTVAEVKETYKV